MLNILFANFYSLINPTKIAANSELNNDMGLSNDLTIWHIVTKVHLNFVFLKLVILD